MRLAIEGDTSPSEDHPKEPIHEERTFHPRKYTLPQENYDIRG